MHVQGKVKYIFEYHPHKMTTDARVFGDDRME